MTVYAIAQITIHDRQRYGDYEAGFMAIFSNHQGKMLAVDEAPVVVEGEWPFTRTVVIEFPSQDAFNAWYHSSEYQGLMQHRLQASVASLAVVAGLPTE